MGGKPGSGAETGGGVHETGGGGYLALSQRVARVTTTWGDMGSKYQDSLIFGRFGEDGHTPYRAQACARVPEIG